MKTGQWRIGRGSCGQMRPKSTGLDQINRFILGKRRENYFLTEPPLLLVLQFGFLSLEKRLGKLLR